MITHDAQIDDHHISMTISPPIIHGWYQHDLITTMIHHISMTLSPPWYIISAWPYHTMIHGWFEHDFRTREISLHKYNSCLLLRLILGSHFFSKYQIPGFLKIFGPKFQVVSSFFAQNSRYFHINFSYKNLLWHKMPCIFQVISK